MFLGSHHIRMEPGTKVLNETQAVSYSQVASMVLLTWDIIVTMSDEVELIWKREWKPVKGMYIAARYLPWIFQAALLAINVNGSTGLFFSVQQCKNWLIVQMIMLQLVVTAVDVILMTRVYAIYNQNHKLLAAMAMLYTGEISFLSYAIVKVVPGITFNNDCFVISLGGPGPLFVAYWVTSLVVETSFYVLTLIKFVGAAREGWGKRPIMRDFISDGTWAYTLIFVAMFVNSMLYGLVHSPLAGVCFIWLLSVLSFAGSRLILSPRRRANEYFS